VVLEWLSRFGRNLASADRALGSNVIADSAADPRGLGDASGAVAAGALPGAEALAPSGVPQPGFAASIGSASAALAAAPSLGPLSAAEAAAPVAPAALNPALAATGSAGPAAGTAAAPVVALPTPVDSPDFAAALAARLTVLVRDGVQEAQLHLNPPEMGPVTVKIALDGAQAQIDFSAAHASTREALGASLPTLAAALHSAGLTLTGGGVSEQRSGAREGAQNEAEGSRGTAGGPGSDEEAGAARPIGAALRGGQGLLDLYA
jgi:flagellar hook-length control protein FliK